MTAILAEPRQRFVPARALRPAIQPVIDSIGTELFLARCRYRDPRVMREYLRRIRCGAAVPFDVADSFLTHGCLDPGLWFDGGELELAYDGLLDGLAVAA